MSTPAITAGFEYAALVGVRVRCIVCGATGFDGGRWQESHIKGHPYKCPSCPQSFSTGQGAAAHHRNVHRDDRFDLYAKRKSGVLAYWERRRKARAAP